MTLREFIKLQGISLREFHTKYSESLGISYGYIRLLSCGSKRPSLDLAVKIQRITNGKVKPENF